MASSTATEPRIASVTLQTPKPWDVPEDIRLEARRLRNMLRPITGRPLRAAITSLGRREGVSWVAAKLSCALAEEGGSTCLVDLNGRHPSQLAAFDAERWPDRSLSGFDAYGTAMKDLWIAAPVIVDNAVLGSSTLDAISALTAEGCSVIVDCDCVSSSATVFDIGPALDGALLIIEAERQRREAVANAIERLQLARIQVLGVVINRQRRYVPEAVYNLL